MSLWRREAIERFPELRREIADVDGLNYLWFDLSTKLEQAYYKDPPDEASIAAIYEYAHWCLKHRSIEVRTAVVISFYEGLLDDERVCRDLPRRISTEDFDMLWFAWEYGTKRDFADLKREFMENKAPIDKEKKTGRPTPKGG